MDEQPDPHGPTEPPDSVNDAVLPLIGVGVAHGGTGALATVLEALPGDLPAVVVVAIHPNAGPATELLPQLQARSGLPVTLVAETAALEPGHVYLAGQDAAVELRDSQLHVDPRAAGQVRHPIDELLDTLASDHAASTIGVLLAGPGTDGLLGLKAIQAAGGLIIVQDPDTAQQDSMLRHAINHGLADYVLAPTAIGELLARCVHHPYLTHSQAAEPTQDTWAHLATILSLIRARTGHEFRCYKKKTLMRRIQRRLGLAQMLNLEDYVDLLRRDSDELKALVRDLMIGVTGFFRDPDAWRALQEQALAPLVHRLEHGSTIRAWVPGCATGEEAYTLAMLLAEEVTRVQRRIEIRVFATDAAEHSLALARTGIYPAGITADISPERLARYFDQQNHHYQVSKVLREMVVFAPQNVINDPPFSRLDIITCRNLMIYLEPEVQQRVIALFHFALREGGFLFLGNAETVGRQDDLFESVSKKHRIYRRLGPTRHDRVDFPLYSNEEGHRELERLGQPVTTRRVRVADLAQDALVDHFAPPAVLVDRKYRILYFHGETEHYLSHPPGEVTNDLLAMAREGLRSKLRAALQAAIAGGQTAVATGARLRRGDHYVAVTITAAPVAAQSDSEALYLVSFQEDPGAVPAAPTRRALRSEEDERHLESELRTMRDELQSTIEELETSNEELKASNEEITSMNEELQSTNEELETSKEELQSLNEEMSTINQQLQAKVEELATANDDLNNLLSSTDVASIFLDSSFRIKWFTPATARLLKVIPSDVGRPLSHLAQEHVSEGLLKDAAQVLDSLVPVARTVRAEDGRWYARRTLPYRTQDNRIDGVVVTFTDVSDATNAQERMARLNEELEGLVAERTRLAEQQAVMLRRMGSELFLAEERERRNLASDLHDGLGQYLVALRLVLARLKPTDDQGREDVAELNALLSEADATVRTLTFQLSPPMLHELGLNEAIEWLADEMARRFGLRVTLRLDHLGLSFSEAGRTILFRSLRELLLNVVKHADAHEAQVSLTRQGNELRLVVHDNGQGFNVDQTLAVDTPVGLGLASIRERIASLGGHCEVLSEPDRGTTITLTVRLEMVSEGAPEP